MRMGFSPFETRVVLGVIRLTSMAGRAHDVFFPNNELSPTVRDVALRAPAPPLGLSRAACAGPGGIAKCAWASLPSKREWFWV